MSHCKPLSPLRPLAALIAILLPASALAANPVAAKLDLAGLDSAERHPEFIVKYRDGSAPATDVAMRTAHLKRAGGVARANVVPMRRLAVGADLVRAERGLNRVEAEAVMRAIAADPAVEYVEVNAVLQHVASANDPLYLQHQWNYFGPAGGTFANWAWNRNKGGGVVIAIVDTGMRRHPDLDAKLLDGHDFISEAWRAGDGNGRDGNANDEGDWNAAGGCGAGSAPSESSWHGTHVAGIAAAVTNNGMGVAGMAPNAKLLPVRVLGKCGGTIADISDGVVWAAGGSVAGAPANRNPAEVINMSIQGPGGCGTTYQRAINQAVNRGSVVVVAAGNYNASVGGTRPANCNNVIAVGATGRTGARASYSNTGDRVDISAPGGGATSTDDYILSTYNSGVRAPGNASYGRMAGTSMAAPHVAGAVALMQHANARTPAQVEQTLKNTARPFPLGCTRCGAGILDAESAVNATMGRYAANTTAKTITANTGQVISALNITRGGNAPADLRIGVYITHPRPADLIVSLQAPDGRYFRLHTNAATGVPGINQRYTVNATGLPAAGQWKLVMRDDYTGQVGTLRRWTMTF